MFFFSFLDDLNKFKCLANCVTVPRGKTPLSEIIFRRYLPNLMENMIFQFIIVGIVSATIAETIFLSTKLKEGLEFHRITRISSEVGEYFYHEDANFRQLNYRIQMVINTPLDYQDEKGRYSNNCVSIDFIVLILLLFYSSSRPDCQTSQ